MDLDAERDAMEKMQASSSRGEAGPSGTINVPSDSDESLEAYWKSLGLSDDE